MNNKMKKKTCLLTIESKNKVSKQGEQRQNHGHRENFNGCQMGGMCWGMVENVRGLRSTNR